MSDRIALLIEELGRELELPEMKLDATNSGIVTTVDDLDIGYTYTEEDDSLTIFTQLGKLAEENREAWYAILLKANFGWDQNRGATLSITPKQQVVLQKSIRLELARLESLTRDFTNFFRWAAVAAGAVRSQELPVDEEAATEPESTSQPTMVDPSMFA